MIKRQRRCGFLNRLNWASCRCPWDSPTSSASGHEFLLPPHQHQQSRSYAMSWISSSFPKRKEREKKNLVFNQISNFSWITPRPHGQQWWPRKKLTLKLHVRSAGWFNSLGTLWSHQNNVNCKATRNNRSNPKPCPQNIILSPLSYPVVRAHMGRWALFPLQIPPPTKSSNQQTSCRAWAEAAFCPPAGAGPVQRNPKFTKP